MATIEKIKDILVNAKAGQYITVKCNSISSDVKADVIQLSPDGNKHIAAEDWTPSWPEPYDAEVEYIQSDGNAYIDTGIALSYTDSLSIALMYTDISDETNNRMGFVERPNIVFQVSQGVFGTTGEHALVLQWFNQSNSGVSITYPNYLNKIATFAVDYTAKDINIFADGCSCDKTYFSASNWPTGTSTNTLQLCRRSDSGVTGKMRIYSCKVSGKIDMIPVRVGAVGYMYDKVSGQLFGNSGTGSFIIGPDKD